jgi:hypothetical protein
MISDARHAALLLLEQTPGGSEQDMQYYDYWRIYTPDQLRQRINVRPVTEDSLLRISRETFSDLFFDQAIAGFGYMHFYGFRDDGTKPSFRIFMRPTLTWKEMLETYAHELMHVHHACSGTPMNKHIEAIEIIIEQQGQRTLQQYPEIIDLMLRDCIKGRYAVPTQLDREQAKAQFITGQRILF